MVNKKPTKQLSLQEKEEQFWSEVNQLAQEKIYQLLTTNIPFQNIALINEPWRYEEAQQKKVGLFLRRDVDYRSLLGDVANQCADDQEWPDQEYLAEEITLWYCRLVMKSLIANLQDYTAYDPSYFSDLTTNEY